MARPEFDWTTVSDDPNDPAAKAQARAHLAAIRNIRTDVDVLGMLEQASAGKRVIDIGVVSHAARYFELDSWRHRKICDAAARCVGVDVIEPLVRELNERGYDVRCVDATSNADIGERFDVVIMGDIVEHVTDPLGLLRFGQRHVAPGGRILVTTPNPYSRKFFRRFRKEGVVVVNLDHVAWITPTMAIELGRRAGMRLIAYHLVKPMTPFQLAVKRLAWRLTPMEYSFPDYVYEFGAHHDNA